MKKIINTPKGTFEIELTTEEIAQREQDAIELQNNRLEVLNKEQEEKARKESAITKLKALGLTEEEVKSIL
jgi:hypothetical protein